MKCVDLGRISQNHWLGQANYADPLRVILTYRIEAPQVPRPRSQVFAKTQICDIEELFLPIYLFIAEQNN